MYNNLIILTQPAELPWCIYMYNVHACIYIVHVQTCMHIHVHVHAYTCGSGDRIEGSNSFHGSSTVVFKALDIIIWFLLSRTFCPMQERMSPSTTSRAETIPFCS